MKISSIPHHLSEIVSPSSVFFLFLFISPSSVFFFVRLKLALVVLTRFFVLKARCAEKALLCSYWCVCVGSAPCQGLALRLCVSGTKYYLVGFSCPPCRLTLQRLISVRVLLAAHWISRSWRCGSKISPRLNAEIAWWCGIFMPLLLNDLKWGPKSFALCWLPWPKIERLGASRSGRQKESVLDLTLAIPLQLPLGQTRPPASLCIAYCWA